MAVLLVSPHFDDVALSAYAVFADSVIGRPVSVLTVFSAAPPTPVSTDWDRRSGFADSDVAVPARILEDEAAFAGLAVERLAGGLVESQYRNGRPLDDDRDALATLVADWLRAHNGIVVVPLGAGSPLTIVERVRMRIPVPRIGLASGAAPNGDHLWLTDTLVSLLPASTPFAFYEEQPYAWVGDGGSERAAVLSSVLGRRLTRRTFRVDRGAKASRASCYHSQTKLIFRPWVRNLASVMARTEAIWF